MKRTKLYFSDIEEDMAYTVEYLICEMKERNISELNVFIAEREIGVDHFFCKAIGKSGLKGEGCGKECDMYWPRNGKNGCCRHWGFCYIPGREFVLSINSKLNKVDAIEKEINYLKDSLKKRNK